MTRSPVAVSLWIGGLILATSGSLAFKSTLPRTSGVDLSGKADAAILAELRASGFVVNIVPRHIQSTLFFARRGACFLVVRDAQNGANDAGAFRARMAPIGPVRYLYRGKRSGSAPDLRVLVYGFTARNLDRFGVHIARDMPVALATGAGCPNTDFGLDRIVVTPS